MRIDLMRDAHALSMMALDIGAVHTGAAHYKLLIMFHLIIKMWCNMKKDFDIFRGGQRKCVVMILTWFSWFLYLFFFYRNILWAERKRYEKKINIFKKKNKKIKKQQQPKKKH